jgi:hypothetical protein
LLVQHSEQITTAQTIQHSHNHCFVESHDKVLDEQQAANGIIIKRQQEQNTIVNQIKKMIKIETVRENNNNMKINTEDEIMNVLSSELMEVKSEKKIKLKSISTKINRSVPETRRILQENKKKTKKRNQTYT